MAWPTYMMLVRPECWYVLSNLAAGYTRSIFFVPNCTAGRESNYKFWEKNLYLDLIIMRE